MVLERARLDPKYDRVQLAGVRELVLACTGATCDLVETNPSGKTLHVPDEVAARSSSGDCVAGRGIACINYYNQWSWALPEAKLEQPIELFLRLGLAEFLAVDATGKAWLVRGDHVQAFETGAQEPLTALVHGELNMSQHWLGRTATGKLVVGSLKAGHTCPGLNVDSIGRSIYRQGNTVVQRLDETRCTVTRIPAEVSGVGFLPCGLHISTLAFDDHRVFSTPVRCMSD